MHPSFPRLQKPERKVRLRAVLARDDVPTNNDRQPQRPLLPTIIANARPLRAITREALAALTAANTPPKVFQRAGQLVRIRHVDGQSMIEALSEAALRGALDRSAQFFCVGRANGLTPTLPPLPVVRDLAALPDWPNIPSLAGLVEAPALRPDGSVLMVSGYDVATSLYYVQADVMVPAIPERPTAEDVARARRLIADVIADFPFADEASKANAIALSLTPLVRPAILGPVPLAVTTAPSPGTGKSLLVNILSIVTTGRPVGVMPETADDEELRKRITAVLRAGRSIVLLDNVQRPLGSPVLAAMLTSDVWEDRLLGSNQTARFPQRATWIVTGNNIRLVGDLPRRAFVIELDARSVRPWERTGFRHPDLLARVRDKRGELLWAYFTLARHWFALGCPKADTPRLGSFEQWARVLGGILAVAGIEGFLGNVERVHEVLAETHLGWEDFLRAWLREFRGEPVTVADIAKQIVSDAAFRAAIPDSLADAVAGDRINVRRLGVGLRKYLDVRFASDGLRLELAPDDAHVKRRRWRVAVDQPEPEGPEGDGRRKCALDLARAFDWPRLAVASGRVVPGGQQAWTGSVSGASDEDIALIIAALEALDGTTP